VHGVVLAGAAFAPLIFLLVTGQSQEEVQVVERSAIHLIERGTPYPAAGSTGHDYQAYNPYLPGMGLFGLPQAVAEVNARVVFMTVFALTLTGAVAVLRAWRHVGPLALVAASPLVTMALAVGGDDLPVLGLACLGLALTVRERPGWARLVIGFAASLKATAWPVAATCLALAAARDRTADALGGFRGGACAAVRAGAAGGVVVAAGVVLPALADAHGFFTNVVAYPLGLTPARSPADSPLPGHLLAQTGPAGHLLVLTLLGLTALVLAVSLAVRLPPDAAAAARRLALGLLLPRSSAGSGTRSSPRSTTDRPCSPPYRGIAPTSWSPTYGCRPASATRDCGPRLSCAAPGPRCRCSCCRSTRQPGTRTVRSSPIREGSNSGTPFSSPRRRAGAATPAARRVSRTASSADSSTLRAWRRRTSPAGVRSTPRLCLINRGAPTSRSTTLICWLSVGVETCSRVAARPKWSSSATATK
jgi:hypothetical protein